MRHGSVSQSLAPADARPLSPDFIETLRPQTFRAPRRQPVRLDDFRAGVRRIEAGGWKLTGFEERDDGVWCVFWRV
ncbi:MAG TPA: hypothetical protein VHL09_15150 [Dehalococcoidia bacterium]|nr:hypothetical protein [Dehalococcoidia bacterium]